MPNDKKRLTDLHARWGIQPDSDAFPGFRNRLRAAFDNVFNSNLSTLAAILFLRENQRFKVFHGQGIGGILDIPNIARSVSEILTLSQMAIWAIEETGVTPAGEFVAALIQARDATPGIDFLVSETRNGYVLLPAGAEELDSALVVDTLRWLEDYPVVSEKISTALQIVMQKDASKYRNALDNLRFALEQFLRNVLNNQKPLEKQKESLLTWMSGKKVHQGVIDMYATLLDQFAKYQNEAVKHGEQWSLPEIEFVVYLTGSFIRLLLRLDQPHN